MSQKQGRLRVFGGWPARNRVTVAVLSLVATAGIAWVCWHSNELRFRYEFQVSKHLFDVERSEAGFSRAMEAAQLCRSPAERRFVENYCVAAFENRTEGGEPWLDSLLAFHVMWSIESEFLPETRESIAHLRDDPARPTEFRDALANLLDRNRKQDPNARGVPPGWGEPKGQMLDLVNELQAGEPASN